jgi:hypothetical protein
MPNLLDSLKDTFQDYMLALKVYLQDKQSDFAERRKFFYDYKYLFSRQEVMSKGDSDDT